MTHSLAMLAPKLNHSLPVTLPRVTDGQTQYGSGGYRGGGYFSKNLKRLKTVLMTFKMLNEAYFEILYQKELENSDILGKIPFFMKISKILKSKFPKK